MPIPNTHPPVPSIKNTRAVINTRWNSSAYRDTTIRSIEQYYVDTALDNDADTWTLTVGDPSGDLLELLARDSEIRVQLFGVGKQGINFLMTGIADDAAYADGSWTLTGRDYSSLATDSTVRPLRFQSVRPWAVVEEQAKYLGFKQTSLAHGKMVKKLELTDGSETYWEFWYRLYRREKMWIWCEPNGLLVADLLNYDQPPAYYIGDSRAGDSDSIKGQSIPVISAELHKTTQSRVYEVIVYGHKGKVGTNTGPIRDNTMSGWIKKPRKVLLDTTNRTIQGMTKIAWDEIFEGKVGELEFKVTIPDPGFVLRQNRIARLNLPDIGLFGNFFIVGSRIQAGPDGFVQEIRLREKQYAVSRRVPVDPKLITGDPRQDVGFSFAFGQQVEQIAPEMPSGWGDYFVAAAKNFHGTAKYDLFLATLLAIANRETGFQNERQHGGPGGDSGIWHPYKKQGTGVFPDPGRTLPGTVPSPGAAPGTTLPTGETRAQYEEKFANNEGGPYHVQKGGLGVGPMQLTSTGLKESADDMLAGGGHDQYEGGRWHPEYNIWIGARYLHECWVNSNATRDEDMWMAADIYNRGLGGWQSNPTLSAYGLGIKKAVTTDPGYLQSVQNAVTAAAQDANTTQRDGPFTAPDPGSGKLSPNGNYVMPLSTPVDLNKSEFAYVEVFPSTGAPDRLGVQHHAAKDWFDPPAGGAAVVAPANGIIVDIAPSLGTSGKIFGGEVKLQMPNGHVWVFRHVVPLAGLQLKQRVKAGDVLAHVVRWSDNPKSSHCHVEFWMTLAGGYIYENMRDPCKILTQ